MENEKSYDPGSNLSYDDLAIDNAACPQTISIKIKRSKTDQEGRGVRVVVGKTANDLCPVVALMNYLALRGSNPGSSFMWEVSLPLTKSRFVSEVRKALSAANLPAANFAGYQRLHVTLTLIGAATTAATAGLEDLAIQTLGRWQSFSYLLYICLELQRLASVSATLANCQI